MKKILIVLFLGLTLSLYGFGGGGRSEKKGRGGWSNIDYSKALAELKLTDDQVKKINEFQKGKIEIIQTHQKKNRGLNESLATKLKTYDLDEKGILELVNQLTELHKEKLLSRLDSAKKLKLILSKEQFPKFDPRMLRHMNNGKGSGRRGKGKGGRDGRRKLNNQSS